MFWPGKSGIYDTTVTQYSVPSGANAALVDVSIMLLLDTPAM